MNVGFRDTDILYLEVTFWFLSGRSIHQCHTPTPKSVSITHKDDLDVSSIEVGAQRQKSDKSVWLAMMLKEDEVERTF